MASERLQKPVLVLNASYEPINVCAARRALVLVLKGVASAEEVSITAVHSARNSVRLPSVIRLLEYRRIPRQTRALSRKNILMRDRYTCQYCHRTMPSGELTLDHVDSAIARRRVSLGEPGGVLPLLQQSQRQPDTRRSGHEAVAAAAAV
jgi:5-methylcytosine-specific restriction endonuclease McrA